jgi:GNAT superfamily N-acetyltransferase
MTVTIRLAKLEDVAVLVELCSLLNRGSEERMHVNQARQQFTKLLSRPEHRIYVAEREGQVVGTFALTFVGGLAHSARDSCIVEDVAVAREHQGTGVGGAMMRYAMRECRGRGCYKLVLSSHVDRQKAHRFYEGLGFRKHGFSFLIEAHH